jgi:DNA-binding transcriptional regulator YdaS (Cro superfamily)
VHETRRYQHRATEGRAGGRQASQEKVLQALAAHRQLLSQHRARIRTLTASRNEMVARAVADGLRISTVAAAVGETVPRVRGIALAFSDLAFDGGAVEGAPLAKASPDEHVHALRKIAVGLESAVASRASVENQLGVLVTGAFRLGFTNETHLASLAGISPESVHQHLRGLRRARSGTGGEVAAPSGG